jgi:hypothetical protein
MRRVYALLGLARRYGAARVTAACQTAVAADMLDVTRLKRMLERTRPPPRRRRASSRSRFLRPASQYALPLHTPERPSERGDRHD